MQPPKKRKKHNREAINLPDLERLLGEGYSLVKVCRMLKVDRKTLYYRRDRDVELEAAIIRGQLANQTRQQREAESTECPIQKLLTEILNDWREIRSALNQMEQPA